jgi:thymidine phosphorylase
MAVGINRVGLDIRVSPFGNFGRTFNEAKINAERFNGICQKAGLYSKCFLSDVSHPQQPYIGRGEAILALSKIFNNQANAHLRKHLGICCTMSASLLSYHGEPISIEILRDNFYQNIGRQGGDINHFNELASFIEEENKYSVKSNRAGILRIDVLKVRTAITKIQTYITTEEFPDPCGIILNVMPGELVEENFIVATFRCKEKYLSEFTDLLLPAFEYNVKDDFSTSLEIVN